MKAYPLFLLLLLTACSNTTLDPFERMATSPSTSNFPPVPTPTQLDARAPNPEPDASPMGTFIDSGVELDAGPAAPCGNGAADLGEECDDGNSVDGDGCNSLCTIEAGFVCGAPVGSSVAVNGSFAVVDPLDFVTAYEWQPDSASNLMEGQCTTRPDPGAEPVLQKNFTYESNIPWEDVDPTADNRTLLCNGILNLTAWEQSLRLEPGRYTFSFWGRSWGIIYPSRIQGFLAGQPQGAPIQTLEGEWRRATMAITIELVGNYTFEIRDLSAESGGNDFALDRIELYQEQPDECFTP